MSRPADEAPRRRERAADVVDLPQGLEKKAPKEKKPEVVDLPQAPDKVTRDRKPESGSSRQSRSRRRPRRKPQRGPKPSVERVMLVSREGDVTQIAVLEEGQIVEHYVTHPEDRSIAGNIYLGRVQNVLPGMEASFIDIGESRNGVLYAGEVGIADDEGDEIPRIETVLKPGQSILVQATKDPMKSKGARLSALVSLAGRHLVLVPRARSLGVSRRLSDRERSRLRDIAQELLPEEHGLIVRTAAEGASRSDLERDLGRLLELWAEIEQKSSKGKAPALVHSEPGLEHRVIRDVFNRDVSRCVIGDAALEKELRAYIRDTTPDLDHRLESHTGKLPIFEEFRVVEQIRKSLDRKVWLPSGGHLVIDRTEAMTVIDVNTGKFVGKSTLEETVFRTNKEAAVEVGRQLRLRDIGGIIVIDFIDMEIAENRAEVFKVFKGELDKDRTRTQVYDISPLGLVQMTRKNVSAGIVEAFSDPCPTCEGRGILIHDVD
ncbi:MAG TPA: Rne/Rng family ribonuclease [Actinomycetota bacterium]|nr:Rne/Rng family ribonuclease [Actinomycetota bacterium]